MKFCVAAFCVALCLHVASATSDWTALDDYVRKPDKVFGWRSIAPTFNSTAEYTLHFYNLTSQAWLTPADSDRPFWHHTLIVVEPTQLNATCSDAFLWITWGSNGHPWKNNFQDDLDMLVVTQMAVQTGCPAVALYDVPNQRMCFPADPQSHPDGPYCDSEDSIIAYTFHKYLYEDKPAEWLMLFPMTKAAVRAMDAAEVIIQQKIGLHIAHWTVSGASKRGWTTWLTGAVDPKPGRVKAIVPMVLDAINFKSFIHRQFRSYNGFTFVLHPYWRWGLTRAVDAPLMTNWSVEIDPFFYRKRLTMPKLAINAVGDEFQLLDDQATWAHEMPGEMHTVMIKDADHLLITNFGLVLESLTSFYRSIVRNTPRPSVKWNIDTTGKITVTTSEPPASVEVIYTTIPAGRRDFRDTVLHEDPCVVHIMGGCVRFLLWSQQAPAQINTTTFSTTLTPPSSGYTGQYIQVTFAPTAGGFDRFVFASPASVLPYNEYPFPACQGSGCNGTMV